MASSEQHEAQQLSSSDGGSDTDSSWTLLDDEPRQEATADPGQRAEVSDVDQPEIQPPSAIPTSSSTSTAFLGGRVTSVESDNDSVELLEPEPPISASRFSRSHVAAHHEEDLPSISSDGIGIAEDHAEEEVEFASRQHSRQYFWSNENLDLSSTYEEALEVAEDAISLLKEDKGTDPKTPEEHSDPEEDTSEGSGVHINKSLLLSAVESLNHEDDEDSNNLDVFSSNMEVIDRAEIESIPHKPNDLSSLYPTEELPKEYPNIQKGTTYNHQRNQRFNVALTTLLVLFAAMALSLGIGHFLGWSARLELQELYAEVREEKMEELTGNLVTCMTGPEAQGGDDQDLDDRVIQHLYEENKNLREELEILKRTKEDDDRIEEELSVILRDRINDLLVMNAELEQEIARLRQEDLNSVKIEENDKALQETLEALQSTKQSLNKVVDENEQLKIMIGKARYSAPTLLLSEREKINILETENDELKKAVRKYRYSPSNLAGTSIIEMEPVAEPDFQDEGFESAYLFTGPDTEAYANTTITLGSFSIGYDTTDDTDLTEENEPEELAVAPVESAPSTPEEPGPGPFQPIEKVPFAAFRFSFERTARIFFAGTTFRPERGLEVLNKVFDLMKEHKEKIMADHDMEMKVKQLESSLQSKFLSVGDFRFTEAALRHVDVTKNALTRLGKCIVRTLDTISQRFTRDMNKFKSEIEQAESTFLQNWKKILDKYDSIIREEEARQFVKNFKTKTEFKKLSHEAKEAPKKSDPILVEQPTPPKIHTSWSAVNASSTSSKYWAFKRAEQRKEKRSEEAKGDWIFDRAQGRKDVQEFNNADWPLKKAKQRSCTYDENTGEDDCVDLSGVNPLPLRRGDKKRRGDDDNWKAPRKSRSETIRKKQHHRGREDAIIVDEHQQYSQDHESKRRRGENGDFSYKKVHDNDDRFEKRRGSQSRYSSNYPTS